MTAERAQLKTNITTDPISPNDNGPRLGGLYGIPRIGQSGHHIIVYYIHYRNYPSIFLTLGDMLPDYTINLRRLTVISS